MSLAFRSVLFVLFTRSNPPNRHGIASREHVENRWSTVKIEKSLVKNKLGTVRRDRGGIREGDVDRHQKLDEQNKLVCVTVLNITPVLSLVCLSA